MALFCFVLKKINGIITLEYYNKREEMKRKFKFVTLFVFCLGLISLAFSFMALSFHNNSSKVLAEQLTNVVAEGGAIHLNSLATFNMTGGTIKGSKADKGGAIYVGNGATFTMSAGKIENCEANYGGAIYVASGGKCYLNGGTITGCLSTIEGNAIYVEDGGYVEMSNSFTLENCGAGYSASIKAVK